MGTVSSNFRAPAIFLDRDGVIIVEKNFQIDPAGIEMIERSLEALKLINDEFRRIIVSNQSGIARGLFSHQDVFLFNTALDNMLLANGVKIDGWYFCPHGPDDHCACRKPRPGMLLDAAAKLDIILEQSWMVGDKSSDIAAGQAAGVRTVLVRTGYGGRESDYLSLAPDYQVDDLYDAIKIINQKAGG